MVKKGFIFIKVEESNEHPPGEWIIGMEGTYKMAFIL
jgi:hypothetical protein